jgi:hypothetical protein
VTAPAPSLPQKIVLLHRALDEAGLRHAFGGALALAWCTERARGTIDIDLNVFVDASAAPRVVEALPDDVTCPPDDLARLVRDGQVRLWWAATPVDLFLDTTEFHAGVEQRVRWEPFAGAEIPFLSCTDLAVFKAFFDRTKDWADLEEMVAAGTLDVERTLGVLVRYLGSGDHRLERLRTLAGPAR